MNECEVVLILSDNKGKVINSTNSHCTDELRYNEGITTLVHYNRVFAITNLRFYIMKHNKICEKSVK